MWTDATDDGYETEDAMWADTVDGCCFEADLTEALDTLLATTENGEDASQEKQPTPTT